MILSEELLKNHDIALRFNQGRQLLLFANLEDSKFLLVSVRQRNVLFPAAGNSLGQGPLGHKCDFSFNTYTHVNI